MIALTRTGQRLLDKWYQDFERTFIAKREDENGTHCNQNDIERAFLTVVGQVLVDEGVFSQDTFRDSYAPTIDSIR